MKVTTALYFLPGGKSTQKIGVMAEVRLPGWFVLEDSVKRRWTIRCRPRQSSPSWACGRKMRRIGNLLTSPDRKAFVQIAAPGCERRKVCQIIKDNKEAADKKGIIQLDDLRKTQKEEGADIEKETRSEQRQKAREQYAPFVNESVNILLDVVRLTENERSEG